MTIAVLAIPYTETTRRTALPTIDMVTSQAKARLPPSAAPDANGRGKGRRTSSRLGMNQERNEEGATNSDKKRKAGEVLCIARCLWLGGADMLTFW